MRRFIRDNEAVIELIGYITGITIAWLLFKPFFPEKGDFTEALAASLTPDIISFFMGRWADDFFASLKMSVWLIISIGGGIGSYYLVHEIVRNVFGW